MKMKKRTVRRSLVLAGTLAACLIGGGGQPVFACPMCKAATEEDDAKPRAYMYSILFMLAVPGTMVGGMAAGLVALSRRESASLAESGLTDDDLPSPPDSSD